MILALTTSRRTCLFFLSFFFLEDFFYLKYKLLHNVVLVSAIQQHEWKLYSISHSFLLKFSSWQNLPLVYQNSKLTFIFNSLKVCYVTRNSLYRKVKHAIQFLFNEEHLYCIGWYLTVALWQSSRVLPLTFCFFSNRNWNNNTCIIFLMG